MSKSKKEQTNNETISDVVEELHIPEELPLLPIRDVVVYPLDRKSVV